MTSTMAPPYLLPVTQWAGIAMPTLFAGITFQYSLTMHLLTCIATTTTNGTPSSSELPSEFSSKESDSDNPLKNQWNLARQWYILYRQGPRWVPPIVLSGTLSNLYLYFFAPNKQPSPHIRHSLLAAAALLTFSILPITFFYFEPGINGACKRKYGQLSKRMMEACDEKGPSRQAEDEDEQVQGEAEPARKTNASKQDEGFFARQWRTYIPASVNRHTGTLAAKVWAEHTDMAELVEGWVRRNHVRWVIGLVAGGLSFLGSQGLCSYH
ncbi:hypothetical protein VTJ49DRAFT_3973 [Mycothermus thermophilus]|uniref:Uncharacterized protein n=1 Tax=Humicola insolens TaxID=85995 RepID=A0ABR3V6H1_HUMIN